MVDAQSDDIQEDDLIHDRDGAFYVQMSRLNDDFSAVVVSGDSDRRVC